MAGEMSFSIDVGIGLRSQNELEHCEMRVVISSRVAGLKMEKLGGEEGGRKCEGDGEGEDRRLMWSFETLSEK